MFAENDINSFRTRKSEVIKGVHEPCHAINKQLRSIKSN